MRAASPSPEPREPSAHGAGRESRAGSGPRASAQSGILLLALLILAVTVGGIVVASLSHNDGHLVYALDDTYIHMSVAKNLVRHGVWGVTPFGFSSSTSSIVWAILLAGTYLAAGVNEVSPLILSLVFALLVVFAAHLILRRYESSRAATWITLLAVIFLTPLPVLVLQGMEHTLQTLVTLLATYFAAQVLSGEDAGHTRQNSVLLLVLAPVVTSTRFEGMFLVAVLGALFVMRSRWKFALVLGAGGFLPVIAFGIFSHYYGGMVLPGSVLLRSRLAQMTSFGAALEVLVQAPYVNMADAPHLMSLIFAALLLYTLSFEKRQSFWESRQVMATIFVAVSALHLEFAQVGSYLRYEAYLVALGILVVALQVSGLVPRERPLQSFERRRWPQYAAMTALVIFLLYPLLTRAIAGLTWLRQATTNIYQQQYQMGRFIRQFYEGSAVALNDIGAVDFIAEIHLLDLEGLGTQSVARLRLRRDFHTGDIERLTKQAGTRMAIVYDHWYPPRPPIGGLPGGWVRVGTWTILNNIVAGGSTVSFYATENSEIGPLMQHLREFSASLPPEVVQAGAYCSRIVAQR